MTTEAPPLFSPGSTAEGSRIAAVLRKETVGGVLLVIGTVLALLWANSRWSDGCFRLLGTEVGPAALHLNLTVSTWAADGLLTIFFFVAGLELKRELVAGDLRDPRRAVVPVTAAVGGMIVPALVYLAIAGGTGPKGWAIPTATDIAFALAVLAVISTHLPAALRTFLLTLAVVDDLLAITVIAVFYSSDLHLQWLLLALVPLAAFAVLVQRGISHWYLLLPLAFATWALAHASGVHATVAGVLLAFAVPVRTRGSKTAAHPEAPGLAEHFEHLVRPVSAGFAVPVFALCSAGVVLGGWTGLQSALSDPIAIGIIAGMVVGKPIGILIATYLTSRITRQPLHKGLTGPTSPGSPSWRASDSPSRCSSASSPSGATRRPTTTSRWPSWPVRPPPRCSPRSCCGSVTATTGTSRTIGAGRATASPTGSDDAPPVRSSGTAGV
jgi:NhaA family Na+:H+ antiporter